MDLNLDFFQGNLRDNTRKEIAKQGFKSVEEFARAHDIDKSTLSRMMNGNREPRLSTLLRISLALDVTIDELCGAGLPQPKAKGASKKAEKPVKAVKPAKAAKPAKAVKPAKAAKAAKPVKAPKAVKAVKSAAKKVVAKAVAKKTAKKAGRK